MADILEILRFPHNWEAKWFGKSKGTPSDAPFKAADEIERLRAKLVDVHTIIPPPVPMADIDLIDSQKVKLFDAVRKTLYNSEKRA